MKLSYKYLLIVWGVVLCSALMLLGCISDGNESSEETTLVKVGQVAPDFTVEMLDGRSIRLSALRGEVVLLTFWDPECPTCQQYNLTSQRRQTNRPSI